MNHPFFTIIQNHPHLQAACRLDITELPEAWTPAKNARAIVLGADPTNDGVRGKKGLIELGYAFGIGDKHENAFWGIQQRNLTAIGLTRHDVYVQNICRNYFANQTAKNKHWKSVATIWLPFLKEELSLIPASVPVLATAEVLMKFLIGTVPKPETIYQWQKNYCFFSEALEREVLPFYRHPQYALTCSEYPYKNYLIERFANG